MAPQHFSYPFRVADDGSIATMTQDTIEDVAQCVMVITRTPIGSRTELPQFGIPRLEFTSPLPLLQLLTAIYLWEPRAATLIRERIESGDDLARDLWIEVIK